MNLIFMDVVKMDVVKFPGTPETSKFKDGG